MQKQNSPTFHWLFPDQIQFFTDQNTAVLQPICLLAANKWQIPFTSSLKCTSLILQMKQIKSLNSFLAQNVLKLTSFHKFERRSEREKKSTLLKNQTFFTSQVVKIPATTHILGQNYGIPWLFPDQFAKFPDFSLTLKKKQISLTFPWPMATLIEPTKHNLILPLNLSIASWRKDPVIPPSILSYLRPSCSRKSSKMSNIFVI